MHLVGSKTKEKPPTFPRPDRVTCTVPSRTQAGWGSCFPSHYEHLYDTWSCPALKEILYLKSAAICYSHRFIHITNGGPSRNHLVSNLFFLKSVTYIFFHQEDQT